MNNNLVNLETAMHKKIGSKSLLKRHAYIIGEALMLVIAVLYLFPAIFVLINSFKTDAEIILNPIAFPKTLSLDNYFKAWNEVNFPVVFGNTLLITVLSTAGIILVSSMSAYILVRSKYRIKIGRASCRER